MRTGIFLLLACTVTLAESGFSAGRYYSEFLDPNEPVAFEKVFYNDEENYKAKTGVFTVPMSGFYIFQFNALSYKNQPMKLELMKNKRGVGAIFGHRKNGWALGANAVILKCEDGDEVYIEAMEKSFIQSAPNVEEVFGSFSGHFLFDDDYDYAFAFSAGITSDQTIGVGKTVVYANTFVNEGRGYNSRIGIFTVPEDGVYVFHYFSLSSPGKSTKFRLYKNYEYFASLFSYCPHTLCTGGNTVILSLRKYDRVTLKAKESARAHGRPGEIFTTFSGYRIPDYDEVSTVAFSVGRSKSGWINMNTIVWYDTINTNLGYGYDSSTGVFTAPRPGVYMFHFYALTRRNDKLKLQLCKNTEAILHIFAHIKDGWASGGSSVSLDLVKGDRVYVKTKEGSGLFSDTGEIYATFSGYRIPDYDMWSLGLSNQLSVI